MISPPRHQPAFAGKITKLLSIKAGDLLLDCTLGDGSHTQEALAIGAKVISLDIDKQALDRSCQFIPKRLQANWSVFQENFAQSADLFNKHQLPCPKAILMDLGTSQSQLSDPQRGFSFKHNAPLDMRLDKRLPVTAKDLVNGLTRSELVALFIKLADETQAKAIAQAIVQKRTQKPITTTLQLASLVTMVKKQRSKIHPATKVFQALRMAVNLERESLRQGLSSCFALLQPQGRFAVISFHSGEDRLVKHYFRSLVQSKKAHLLNQKPIKPEKNQLLINPKIRSAKLRLIQKN